MEKTRQFMTDQSIDMIDKSVKHCSWSIYERAVEDRRLAVGLPGQLDEEELAVLKRVWTRSPPTARLG